MAEHHSYCFSHADVLQWLRESSVARLCLPDRMWQYPLVSLLARNSFESWGCVFNNVALADDFWTPNLRRLIISLIEFSHPQLSKITRQPSYFYLLSIVLVKASATSLLVFGDTADTTPFESFVQELLSLINTNACEKHIRFFFFFFCFFLFCILILLLTKPELVPFFSNASSAAILNFKMAAIFSLFWTVFGPKSYKVIFS